MEPQRVVAGSGDQPATQVGVVSHWTLGKSDLTWAFGGQIQYKSWPEGECHKELVYR